MKILLYVVILSVMMEGMIGVIQYVTKSNIGSFADHFGETQDMIRFVGTFDNIFRVKGTFNYDTAFGTFIGLYLPLIISLIYDKSYHKYKIPLVVVFFFGLLALIFTFTRGAWLGTIIGSFVALYYIGIKGYITINKFVIYSAIILASIGVLSTFFSTIIIDRLFGDNSTDSLESRAYLIRAAIQIIRNYPWFGVGLHNFGIACYGFFPGHSYFIKSVHNIFLLMASETGILGSIIFSIWLFYILKIARNNIISDNNKSYTIISIGLMGGIIASIVQNIQDWSILNGSCGFCFWATAGVINAIASYVKE